MMSLERLDFFRKASVLTLLQEPVFSMLQLLRSEVLASVVSLLVLQSVEEPEPPCSERNDKVIIVSSALKIKSKLSLNQSSMDCSGLQYWECSSRWLDWHQDRVLVQPARSSPPQLMMKELFWCHPSGGAICRVNESGNMLPGLRSCVFQHK